LLYVCFVNRAPGIYYLQLNYPILSETTIIVKMVIQLFNHRIDVVPKWQLFHFFLFKFRILCLLYFCLSVNLVLSFRISDSFSSCLKLTVVRFSVCLSVITSVFLCTFCPVYTSACLDLCVYVCVYIIYVYVCSHIEDNIDTHRCFLTHIDVCIYVCVYL